MSVTIENKEYYTLEKLRSGGFKPLPTTRDGILKEIPEKFRIFYQNGEKNGLKKVNGGGSIGVLAEYANSVWRAPGVPQKKIPQKKKTQIRNPGIPLTECLRVVSNQSNYSCLYFLCLEVGEDFLICKYGRTKKIKERLRRHKKTFGGEISLIFTVAIDSYKLAEAENELKKTIKSSEFLSEFRGGKCEEIFKIPATRIQDIKEEMKSLKAVYSLELKERGAKISEQEREISRLKKQIEEKNQSVSTEIVQRDKEITDLKFQLERVKTESKTLRLEKIRELKKNHIDEIEKMRSSLKAEIYESIFKNKY